MKTWQFPGILPTFIKTQKVLHSSLKLIFPMGKASRLSLDGACWHEEDISLLYWLRLLFSVSTFHLKHSLKIFWSCVSEEFSYTCHQIESSWKGRICHLKRKFKKINQNRNKSEKQVLHLPPLTSHSYSRNDDG